ncbi:MAG TPA: hypothetical protein VIK64_11500 [Anaerolineales bacterium]
MVAVFEGTMPAQTRPYGYGGFTTFPVAGDGEPRLSNREGGR